MRPINFPHHSNKPTNFCIHKEVEYRTMFKMLSLPREMGRMCKHIPSSFVLVLIILASQCCVLNVFAQDTPNCLNMACYPRFIDLIQDLPNRTVEATSTCGTPPAFFEISFTSSSGDVYQMDICNASSPVNAHPPSALHDSLVAFVNFMVPNLDSWWQSENGASDVQLTLSLGNRFLFQETRLAFRSLRPSNLLIEKSGDFGQTWTALQYFAESCSQTFPGVPVTRVELGYTPICEERYVFGDELTKVPNSDIQEVRYNPAQQLGSAFSKEGAMRYFTLTNIRITLGQPGSEGSLRSYFAIADWLVSGQCPCFGHAEQCIGQDLSECLCQHNTEGRNCERCQPLFNNRPWQTAMGQGEINVCQDCGCNGLASSCIYDEAKGYGICQGCTENTFGDKCERCSDNFFRNPFEDPANNDTCIACICDVNGTLPNSICSESNGSCTCKLNVQNMLCDECMDTFFNLNVLNPVGCQPCDCDPVGSLGSTNFCDKLTGQCICKSNVEGSRCDRCKTGTFNLDVANPAGCSPCSCDFGASLTGNCDETTGLCTCRANIAGRSCNETLAGYYVPYLDGMTYEAELADADNAVTILERPTGFSSANHTGRGFLAVTPNTVVTFANVGVPRNQNYQIILRYESTATYPNVLVELSQQVPTPYLCGGLDLAGVPTGLVADVPSAGEGGARQFGEACLHLGSLYNVTVSIGLPEIVTTSDMILLDSLVLLPVLADVSAFSANTTSDVIREEMTSCWMAAVYADQTPRRTGNCGMHEFAIMAELNDGAVECSCNTAGTTPNTICNGYGGQCQCVEGVTSRSCDYCLANHFGYNIPAGCQPCGCHVSGSVSLSCSADSGVCDCHQNVLGTKCDSCQVDHYGLSTGAGCVPCTCDVMYSLDNTCDDSGQCNCLPGVGGLNCDGCSPGFFQLSQGGCISCQCDTVGSTQAGCDASGSCLCREGTEGEKCDACKQGFYGFGPWSERGCTQCYCYSHSAQCTSALSWFTARVSSSWSLLDFAAVAPRWTGVTGDGVSFVLNEVPILDIANPRLILELSQLSNTTDFFFLSPSIYHGDFHTAYGQYLTFTLSQSTGQDPAISPEGDVFIDGTYVTEPLAAALPSLPNVNMQVTKYSLKLHENDWRVGNLQGDQPTAEYVMQVLAGIRSIRIRAKYTLLEGGSVFLHDAMLDYASQGDGSITGETADFVENCTCPLEYTGLFCEMCAPGLRLALPEMGPFSDCVPCSCNGHSSLPCDPTVGVCQGCGDNTGGDFCQICLPGYYGDATGRTPVDCRPCQCPGVPGAVNSFASTCDGSGVCINCTTGHSGDRCQTCVPGYYGLPTDTTTNNGQCQPCFCGLSPPVCDAISGQCLSCAGNTSGLTCDVCDFGFWGTVDNCQECICNATGGDGNCSRTSGVCDCYPNVVGDQCTRCAADTWGIDSGSGCQLCGCHPVGTVNQLAQCDLVTGQCACKVRVTGRQCDQCEQGFYSVNDECIPCDCNLEGIDLGTCDASGNCSCDLVTGQCGCRTGNIGGLSCDRCGQSNEGAFPNCDPCPACFQNFRLAFEIMADVFLQQQALVSGLLANYGNLTVTEVDSVLSLINGSLYNASIAIQEGTREVVGLEDIEAGYRQISFEVANLTDLVLMMQSQQDGVSSQLQTIAQFNGNAFVDSNVVRNASELQAELTGLETTQTALFQLGNGSWIDVQGIFSEIEASEQRIQQLLRDVDSLLTDIERAALDRASASAIIDAPLRDIEYSQNAARLNDINTLQESYPLTATAQNVSSSMQLASEVNLTTQGVAQSVQAVLGEAMDQAYRSEMVRFNATNVEMAARATQSAAVSYKDEALSVKSNITANYIQLLEAFGALQAARFNSSTASNLAQSVQNMFIRTPTEMTELVDQINAASLNQATVEALQQDARSKLGRAERAMESAVQAQQEAESVSAQLQTIIYELAEADRVREAANQRLAATNDNVNSTTSTIIQVQQQAGDAVIIGRQTAAATSTILQEVMATTECFQARRNQAEDAANRAGLARAQAGAAYQTFVSSTEDTATLNVEIEAVRQQSFNTTEVQTLAASAASLKQDVVSVQQITDLNALMSQYIDQQTQMETLNTTLERLEISLEAILTNLDIAEPGDLPCS